MISISNTVTPSSKQWERIIAGMRNPMNSWKNSDTAYFEDNIVMGDNDYNLIKRLCKAGTDHRKFTRAVQVLENEASVFDDLVNIRIKCRYFYYVNEDKGHYAG